jgi:hypothetical protein
MRSESQTEYEPTLQNARVLFQMRPKKIQTSQKSGKTPLTLCGPEEFPPWPSDEGAEAGPLLSRLQGEVSQQSISEICKQWPCALPVWVRSLRGLLGNRRADLNPSEKKTRSLRRMRPGSVQDVGEGTPYTKASSLLRNGRAALGRTDPRCRRIQQPANISIRLSS